MDKHAVELEHPRDVGRENRAVVEEVVRLRQENHLLRSLVLAAVADLEWAGVEATVTEDVAQWLRESAADLRAALGERRD